MTTTYSDIRDEMCSIYTEDYFSKSFDINELPHCSIRTKAVMDMLRASNDAEYDFQLDLIDQLANKYSESSATRIYFLYALMKAYYSFKKSENERMMNILTLVINIATCNDSID